MTGYTAKGGQFYDPSGKPFIPRGVGVIEGYQPKAAVLGKLLPGANCVRLAVLHIDAPLAQKTQTFITAATGAGVVVIVEDHCSPSAGDGCNTLTGAALAERAADYAALAKQYAANPRVWWGTRNEPACTPDPNTVSAEQVAIYNAIRGAGNTAPILLELWGGWWTLGILPSDVAKMTNVAWDIHIYGNIADNSLDPATIRSKIAAAVARAKAIPSADGEMAMIVGECGPSSDGATVNPNWPQLWPILVAMPQGLLGWGVGPGPDNPLNRSYNALSTWGKQLAAYLANAKGT